MCSFVASMNELIKLVIGGSLVWLLVIHVCECDEWVANVGSCAFVAITSGQSLVSSLEHWCRHWGLGGKNRAGFPTMTIR